MKQFKNILLVAPLDKQLIAQAASILKMSQAKLTLMSVAPLIDDSIVKTSAGKTVDLQDLLVEDLKSELEQEADLTCNPTVHVRQATACAAQNRT